MTMVEWIRRLVGTLRAGRNDRDLERELQSHLEFAEDEARRGGVPADRTRRAAVVRDGGVAQAMDRLRDQRGLPWLTDLARDLRYACRILAASPSFTVVSVLSLAIGIGVTCAVFSFADALLLRPLPVARAGEVVTVGSPGTARRVLVASYRDYVDIAARATSFDGMVAFSEAAVRLAAEADVVPKAGIGLAVSGNFFGVMGVEPSLGRVFRPDEDQVPGRDAVVVLADDFWTRELGRDAAVLGRLIHLNGIAFTVVGVAPPGFAGLDRYTHYQFFVPLAMWPRLVDDPALHPLEARDFRSLTIKGRLRRGVTIADARAEVAVVGRDLERTYPDTNRRQDLLVRTELQDRLAESPQIGVLMLMLALLAVAVLLVACGNVGGLLASRAPTRAREIALRLAIGAGRGRVIRQLVTESTLIALLGGACGLGVAYAGVLLFRQWRIPTDLPIAASFALDGRALAVSVVVALVSAAACGLGPAFQLARTDLTTAMKTAEAAGFGRRRRWTRAVMVGAQVSISVVLLVVAAFIFRGFQQRFENGPGFRTDHVLLMWFSPPASRYSQDERQRFFERLAEGARQTPGVRSATLTSYVPLDGAGGGRAAIVPDGVTLPSGTENVSIQSSAVDESYFDTLKIPILAGRGFLASDAAGAPRVAVVNEQLAEHFWPGQPVVGKHFHLTSVTGPLVEIVGLAKTTKYISLIEPPVDVVYVPHRQRVQPLMALLAESAGDPSTLVAPLREMVRRLDAAQPIYNVRTLDEHYRMRAVVIFKVITTLIGAMGAMGIALALVGLYGLVAYAVSRRTREIGIRMAIGADRSDVLRMILAQGMRIATVGLAVGLLAGAGAGRLLTAVFPGGPRGDGRTDVVAFLIVTAAVAVVTLLAAYLPARRASRIDPTEALRME